MIFWILYCSEILSTAKFCCSSSLAEDTEGATESKIVSEWNTIKPKFSMPKNGIVFIGKLLISLQRFMINMLKIDNFSSGHSHVLGLVLLFYENGNVRG